MNLESLAWILLIAVVYAMWRAARWWERRHEKE